MQRRKYVKTAGLGIASVTGLAGCLGADGGDYPNDDIEIVVVYGEGGGVDMYTREIASALENELEVGVQVTNNPGAGGLTGTGEVKGAEPDGYTYVAYNLPSVPVAQMGSDPGFDIRELEAVAMHSAAPYLVIADSDENIEDYNDVVERYADGEYSNFGGGHEPGGLLHVASGILNEVADLEFDEYIGYDGSGPLTEAVASGEVPVGVSAEGGAQSGVEEGEVEVITSLSTIGSNLFTDVPIITDMGYENIDYVGETIRCLWAPPETPDDIIATFNEGLENAIEGEELQEWSEETDNPLEFQGPEAAQEAENETFEEIPAQVDLDQYT